MFFGALIPALRPSFWVNFLHNSQAGIVLVRDACVVLLGICFALYLAFVGYRKVRVALGKV